MTTSNAIESQGTTIGISTGASSPIAYTLIGDVVGATLFDGQAAEIDITHLASTGKEFLMGLQDFGTAQLQTNYVQADAGQTIARAAKASRAKHYFQLTLSNGLTASFAGYVLSAPMTVGVDSKLDGSIAIRITGDVTFV